MNILVLDQATTSGYAVFEINNWEDDAILVEHGHYTAKGSDFEEKIFDLCRFVSKLINEHEIDFVVLENVQAQSNINTHKKLCMLLGALLELCDVEKVKYDIVSSNTWRTLIKQKKGMKRKELKQLAQKFVLDKYGIETTEDEADSICLGTYYLQHTYNIEEE